MIYTVFTLSLDKLVCCYKKLAIASRRRMDELNTGSSSYESMPQKLYINKL